MAKKSSIFAQYRIFPLILAGAVILALLTVVLLSIWTLVAYLGHQDLSQAGALASGLYLLLLFVSCFLMTRLIRGGTVFPALALSLLAAVATFFLSGQKLLFFPALGKILLSLIAGILGFILAKLIFIRKRQQRRLQVRSQAGRRK